MQNDLPSAPGIHELSQTGPLQQRSLSLPHSRIVLNPQDFTSETSEVEQNCDPTLPLGLGYYAFDKAITMPRLLSFWRARPRASNDPAVDVSRIPHASWVAGEDGRLAADQGSLEVTLDDEDGGYVGSASCWIRVPDDAPVLRLCVRDVEGQWSLRVQAADGEPVVLQHGSAICGLHYLDLSDIATTGDEVELVLGVVGHRAKVVIDEIAFVAPLDTAGAGADEFETDWSPAGLGATVRYAEGAAEGNETFVGLDSFVRELRFTASSERPPLVVIGRHLAKPSYREDGSLIGMIADGFVLVTSIPDAVTIRFFSHEAEWMAGGAGSPTPVHDVGIWVVELREGREMYRIGCGVDPRNEARAVTNAEAAARNSALELFQHWASYWDGVLARMPHPEDFAIRGVEPGALDEADVRAAYYHAFIGLYSNVLPPQPEIGYDYPTVATGKGSMWNHGTNGARSAAAWETFLAIQFLAYLDPEVAWGSFVGLMSRVDDDGSLGGESLPSRKAQTAAILYALTGDAASLAESYPGLRRLLVWQADRPRWIYGTYDFPGEQDAEFLTSLLIDLVFASELAHVLGLPDDAAEFDRLRAGLSVDYRDNCFVGAGRDAVQHWFPDDPSAALRGGVRGFGLQVASGLAVRGLTGWQRASLVARFEAQFDPGDQLAGFDFVKHPNVGHTAMGLLDIGRAGEAQALVNAVARDVILSGSFAEVYDRGPERPKPWGVRPSIFGMTQVVDAVWLNNGVRMDLGMPRPVAMPGIAGGVHGIRIGDAIVSLRAAAE